MSVHPPHWPCWAELQSLNCLPSNADPGKSKSNLSVPRLPPLSRWPSLTHCVSSGRADGELLTQEMEIVSSSWRLAELDSPHRLSHAGAHPCLLIGQSQGAGTLSAMGPVTVPSHLGGSKSRGASRAQPESAWYHLRALLFFPEVV